MRLRFRRVYSKRFVLLSFGVLSIAGHFALGQDSANLAIGQDSENTVKKPNGFIPVDSQGSLKRIAPQENPVPPPLLDSNRFEPRQTELRPKVSDQTILSDDKPEVIASDVDRFVDESIDEAELFSALALKVATASMSHVSPFFWWMAAPTSNIFADEAVETYPIEPDEGLVENVASAETDLGTSALPEDSWVEDNPIASVIAEKNEASESSSSESNEIAEREPLEPAPRKPVPRTIRTPFELEPEITEPVIKNTGTKRPMKRDPDSQRDQEEPQLDPQGGGNDRDQQGIDAILASKPEIGRREIRIDDSANEGISVAPIVQSKPSDPVFAKRLQRTEACLTHYLDNHPESTSVRSPWAVMHAVLAFGGDYELTHGQGRVNAISWMCHNGTCRTQRMFTPKGIGFTPNVGDGVQGHEGQFLAILAQCDVPLNYPIQVGSSKFTVEDLVRHEMATCKEKSELTFKLIGLSYYLDSNEQWRANDGKTWSIQKLIQEELSQPIIGAACGGVHRLMGFAFSVKQRQLQGHPVNGQYVRAAKFVRDYIEYTWQLQNPDGSFSTNWYEGRGNEPKDERKIQTSGHMLEWLMFSMTDEEIKNPRVGKGIDFLLSKIYDQRDYKWPIGPRGHATRAIALYQARTKEILGRPSSNLPIRSVAKPGPSVPFRK